LWVAYLAGTLLGLDTRGDTLHDAAETCGKQLRSDGGRGMPETVAYEYIIGRWVFLVDGLAESAFTESLLAVNAVIDGRTIWCATEAIFDCPQFR